MRRCAHRAGVRPNRLRCHAVAVLLLLLLGSGLLVACGGDDDDRAPRSADARAPHLSLAEVESVLERGRLGVVRTGGADRSPLGDVPARLVESARYASQSGREFDVYVFASERDARRALSAILPRDEEASSEARAANVVAVFPQRFREQDAYRAAASAMRRLRSACTPGGAGQQRLRRLCFSADGGVPPEGEGVDRDEAAASERPVVVDGLRYEPVIARRLNHHIEPDSELLSGRAPSDGTQWLGVFLRVCNDGDATRTSSARLALVNAFGGRLRPSDALPDGNPFVYRTTAIEPDTCLPRAGSTAARVSDGVLVPFEAGSDFVEGRPIALEVVGDGGRRQRVVVDL